MALFFCVVQEVYSARARCQAIPSVQLRVQYLGSGGKEFPGSLCSVCSPQPWGQGSDAFFAQSFTFLCQLLLCANNGTLILKTTDVFRQIPLWIPTCTCGCVSGAHMTQGLRALYHVRLGPGMAWVPLGQAEHLAADGRAVPQERHHRRLPVLFAQAGRQRPSCC